MTANLRPYISPSILSADFGRLAEEIKCLLSGGAHALHIDMMDGHFVPNFTIGPPILASISKLFPPDTYFDCHLMVDRPHRYVEQIAKAGGKCFTFHWEAAKDNVKEICRSIHQHKMHCGLAFSPKTSIPYDLLQQLVDQHLLDKVLVMTVEPGFGGQKFMGDMMDKVKGVRSRFKGLDIQVDGGINLTNLPVCLQAGANWIVVGTALLNLPYVQRHQFIAKMNLQLSKALKNE